MQAYLDLLQHILDKGESHNDRTGVGTLSVFGYQFRHSMSDGFPLLTTKKLPFRWIAEELFWFLSGSTNEHDLHAKGVDIWHEWATAEQCAKFGRTPGELGPVYGHLWRNFGGWKEGQGNIQDAGTDQIANLMAELQMNPFSRRLIVSGWHPYWQQAVALPPCHTLWQLKVHEGEPHGLSLHLYARSIDTFLGLPFNIASYALLLSLISHCADMVPRDLIISFGDVHLYTNHLEQAKQQLSREPRPLPDVNIAESLRGTFFTGIAEARFKHLLLVDYKPMPKISATVAV